MQDDPSTFNGQKGTPSSERYDYTYQVDVEEALGTMLSCEESRGIREWACEALEHIQRKRENPNLPEEPFEFTALVLLQPWALKLFARLRSVW